MGRRAVPSSPCTERAATSWNFLLPPFLDGSQGAALWRLRSALLVWSACLVSRGSLVSCPRLALVLPRRRLQSWRLRSRCLAVTMCEHCCSILELLHSEPHSCTSYPCLTRILSSRRRSVWHCRCARAFGRRPGAGCSRCIGSGVQKHLLVPLLDTCVDKP